MICVG